MKLIKKDETQLYWYQTQTINFHNHQQKHDVINICDTEQRHYVNKGIAR